MQNHQGSIHVSKAAEDPVSPVIDEQLDFNKNQLAEDTEMIDQSL